jgi:biopolymer transport protein ExbB
MQRPTFRGRALARSGLALALFALMVSAGADAAPGGVGAGSDLEILAQPARAALAQARAWYLRTPPADRVTWGGLTACATLALGVMLERMVRLRRRKVVPRDFAARFMTRLEEGRLDRGKALDFCELNPSPAARVALGAVRRWDRPVTDQERAVSLAVRVEADRLRRSLGTLRRIAALAPLVGLLGSLMAAGRALAAGRPDWGPALAGALSPLTAGVALGILALVAFDGLSGRFEALVASLERLGAETIDAIAMSLPAEPRGPARTPHSIRVEMGETPARPSIDRDADFA